MTNRKAFLDMIAFAEGTSDCGDQNGYNVLFGKKLFYGYADHPRVVTTFKNGTKKSTAAGRYQILAWIFDHYKKQLGLLDFSPESQDKIALQLIKECKALGDIDAGRFDIAVQKCKSRWASLPGAGYDQPEKNIKDLRLAYLRAGGEIIS